MSGREVFFRVRQALRARLENLGIGLARPTNRTDGGGKAWVDVVPRDFAVSHYQLAADRILAGQFDVLSLHGASLGFPPHWNRDAKTGTQAPLTFGKLIDYRDEKVVGDIKYLWEPNRHLELVTLAQAWHLTGDERYLTGCRELLTSWLDECPYPLGPNWCSSLELAIRLINWSFAWQLLGADDAPMFRYDGGRQFKDRWCCAIFQHCHFVAKNLSRHSSANNHLLGELAGLFIAATTWPCWSESQSWRQSAMRELEHEVRVQNSADGVNREQATWYHHEVADMMLLAGLIARASAGDFSAAYWQRFESMLEFIASIMSVAGKVPAIGDSDDAVIVRLSPARDFNVYRSLLASGAVLFGRGDFKAKVREFDDKSRWLLGDAAAEQFARLPAPTDRRPVRRAFPDAGYFVLGGQFGTANEVLILADAGSLGFLSIAAHGHADALSFTLSAYGEEMLVDTGTFAYHAPMRWREFFRGTSGHNTVRLDGQNQSLSGGRFLWLRHAVARVIECQLGGDSDRLVAVHDGYEGLTDPVQSRREWLYSPSTRVLSIRDTLRCRKRHALEIFWHFDADCDVCLHEDHATASCRDAALKLYWPKGLSARLARGEEDPPLGWQSREYDSKLPSFTLVVSGPIRGNWSGVSEVQVLDRGRQAANTA